MTVETETSRVVYVGAGTTGPFSIPFYFLANGDIRAVKVTIADGTEDELTLTTDYTLTGAGDEAGGALTLVSSLSSSFRLVIFRDPELLQEADYSPNDAFPSETHEQVADRSMMVNQRSRELAARALRQPDGDATDIAAMPAAVSRASKFLAFDGDGDPIASEAPVAGTGTPVSAFMATVLDDATAAAARATFGAPSNADIARDLVINGHMSVWQDRTSIAAIAHRDVLADRFLHGITLGSSVFTGSRSTNVPDATVQYSIRLECTTDEASTPAGAERHLRYALEGYELKPYVGETLSVAFYVRSNRTGTFCLGATNSARDLTFVREYTVLAADTWEEKVLTIPLDYASGTWDYTTGVGLGLRWALYAGTTFRTTPNAWNAGNFVGTSNQLNLAATIGDYIEIAKVRIYADVAAGVTATYQPMPHGETLALVNRYRRVLTLTAAGGVTVANGFAPGTDSANFDVLLSPPMRAAPAISVRGTLNTDIICQKPDGTARAITAVTSVARSPDYAKWTADGAGVFTANETVQFRIETTTGKFIIDAELP